MVTDQTRVGKTSLVRVFVEESKNQPDVLAIHAAIGQLGAASGSRLGRLGRDLVDLIADEHHLKFGKPLEIEIPSLEDFRDSFNSAFQLPQASPDYTPEPAPGSCA